MVVWMFLGVSVVGLPGSALGNESTWTLQSQECCWMNKRCAKHTTERQIAVRQIPPTRHGPQDFSVLLLDLAIIVACTLVVDAHTR